jgi:hypothetical protein
MAPLSRRAFLAASAGAVVLAACSGSSDEPDSGTDATSTGGSINGALQTIQFFPDGVVGDQGLQRFPFGVGDADGVIEGDRGPGDLRATIVADDGTVVAESLVVKRHQQGLTRPYWPLVTEGLAVGIYDVRLLTDDGIPLPEATISVAPASAVVVKQPGQPMPALPTPSVDEPNGVDPICTDDPPCPLHTATLADALAAGGKGVVLLVGTPAYCETAICGPVLDLLLQIAPEYEDRFTFLHAEVYTDETLQESTLAVRELGLTFEPSLFVVDARGTIAARLDVIYDEAELRATLDAVS